MKDYQVAIIEKMTLAKTEHLKFTISLASGKVASNKEGLAMKCTRCVHYRYNDSRFTFIHNCMKEESGHTIAGGIGCFEFEESEESKEERLANRSW